MTNGLYGYPEYQDSGVEWLGEIPAHWEVISLRAITEVKNQRNQPELLLLSVYREYGVIPRDSRDDNYNPRGKDLSSYKVVDSGDLVLNKMKTWQGSLGVSAHKGIVSPAYIVCRILGDINSQYLHSLLRSRIYVGFYNRISFGVRVNQWDMRYQDFKQTPVLIPPPDEQAAIVRFLDEAERRIRRYIRAKQKLIKLLNEQKQAIIQQAVTRGLDPDVPMKDSGIEWLGEIPAHWEVTALRYRYSAELGKMLDEKKLSGSYLVPYLRNVDVRWGYVNVTDLPQIDIRPDEYERFLLKPGDMLICEGGAGVGRTGFWKGQLPICAYQKALHRVRVRDANRDEPHYLFYLIYLVTKLGVIEVSGGISTIPHLTNEKLRAYRFSFPPKEEQTAIVQFLDDAWGRIDNTISQIEDQIAIAREYRTRLIADVVTGKVDVRGVAFEMPATFDESDLTNADFDETGDLDELDMDEAFEEGMDAD